MTAPQASATVTTTACPASILASASVALADHVQVTLRSPSRPLVQGVVA